MTTGWGFKALLALLALAAWPYLALGPVWLVLPALALPLALGRWAPAPGLGLLLALAPLVDAKKKPVSPSNRWDLATALNTDQPNFLVGNSSASPLRVHWSITPLF